MLLRYNSCPPSAQNSPLLAFVILVEASVPTVSVKVQMITPPFHHLVWLSGSSQCSLCFSLISLNAVSWVWWSCSFQYSPIFFPLLPLKRGLYNYKPPLPALHVFLCLGHLLSAFSVSLSKIWHTPCRFSLPSDM